MLPVNENNLMPLIYIRSASLRATEQSHGAGILSWEDLPICFMIPRSSALTSALHTVVAHHERRAEENVRNIRYGANRPIWVLFMSLQWAQLWFFIFWRHELRLAFWPQPLQRMACGWPGSCSIVIISQWRESTESNLVFLEMWASWENCVDYCKKVHKEKGILKICNKRQWRNQ